MTQYREGADVLTAQGDKVGTIKYFVMRPHDMQVTHLVVRGGAMFNNERVVPIEMVAETYSDRVLLRSDSDLNRLTGFEPDYYVPVADDTPEGVAPVQTPGLFYYGGISQWSNNNSGFIPVVEPPTRQEPSISQSIPDDAVLIGKGTDVYSSDGQHVGAIERVITDTERGPATHFVIAQGILLKSRKLVPVDWISQTRDKEIDLAVSARQLERLPDYAE